MKRKRKEVMLECIEEWSEENATKVWLDFLFSMLLSIVVMIIMNLL
jgi:hypothetical protein